MVSSSLEVQAIIKIKRCIETVVAFQQIKKFETLAAGWNFLNSGGVHVYRYYTGMLSQGNGNCTIYKVYEGCQGGDMATEPKVRGLTPSLYGGGEDFRSE
jgi:hypothetical protein